MPINLCQMYNKKKIEKKIFLKGGAGGGVEIRFKTEFWKTKFEFEKKSNLHPYTVVP